MIPERNHVYNMNIMLKLFDFPTPIYIYIYIYISIIFPFVLFTSINFEIIIIIMVGWLVACFLGRIKPSRLFNAKSSLYLYIAHIVKL